MAKVTAMRVMATMAPFSLRWEPLFIRCSQKAMALPNHTIGCGSRAGSPKIRSSNQPKSKGNMAIRLIIAKYLVDTVYIHILSYMVSQLVILFLLEVGKTLYWTCSRSLIPEQIFDDGRIVEEAVDIGADAMIGLEDGLVSIADTLMDLIALAWLTIELEGDLAGGLLGIHRSVDGQNSKTWQTRNIAFNPFRVFDDLS